MLPCLSWVSSQKAGLFVPVGGVLGLRYPVASVCAAMIIGQLAEPSI